MKHVVLGLGSNKSWQESDSIHLLAKAVDALKNLLSDVRCSSVYKTRPMYVQDQPPFLNMVLSGFADDSLSPHYFLNQIHRIEAILGRNRAHEIRNGPRSIDIDIEFFGDCQICTSDLEIPHPRIAERAFVLVPLLEILSESADSIDRASCARSDCERMLDAIGTDGVEKVMDATQFVSLA